MRFGGYCYSIYLSHFILLSIIDPARKSIYNFAHMDKLPDFVNFILYFPVVSLFALGIGFVSFNIIEKPCVRMGKELIKNIENMILMQKNECKLYETK